MRRIGLLLTLWVCLPAPASAEEKAVGTPASGVRSAWDFPLTDAAVTEVSTLPALESQPGKLAVELRTPALKVQRRASTELEDAPIGTRVRPQDTLITDEATTAQIQLMDGSLLVLGPSSRLHLSERSLTTRGIRTMLTLYHGRLRIKISPTAHAGGFVLRTTAMQLQTEQPSSVVVTHREAQEVGKRGCSVVTLLSGHVQTLPAGSVDGGTVLNRAGQQVHYCDQVHADPVLPELSGEALAQLMDNIPFYKGEEPHPGDDLPLPAPALPDSPSVGATPAIPGLPGIIVAPPRVIGDTPFEFTPGVPEGLTPVYDISP